ncbi:MAG: peptidylprolyl isomerase [Clostridia bacterium]|nr:peptidylprolyl isomerase [Clostridia bacterium]
MHLKTPIEVEVLAQHPVAIISFQEYDPIVIELYPEIAPNTVNNFIELSKKEYYNGLTFHKTFKDFMIQSGDPTGNGTGNPGYTIEGEFYKENQLFNQYLSHKRGVISMARSADPNSAGSQFFILEKDEPSLDLSYSAFGKVIKGIETVDLIASFETDDNGIPVNPVVIESIQIELNGYEALQPIINEETKTEAQ